MGAEALGRGATLVIGVEQSSRACAVIQQNWQTVARPPQTFQVMRGDVLSQLKKLAGQKFDRIYFDPPYGSDLYQPVMETIANYHFLAADSELAVEHRSKLWRITVIPGLEVCREKHYGNTALTFYRIPNGER
jgi:16S rRNA (guanine(966)-N(2))-methyltransferase RsmD